MKKQICLKNSKGQVIRILPNSIREDRILVTRNPEDQRLLFRPVYEKKFLETQGWEILKELSCHEVLSKPIPVTPELTLTSFQGSKDSVILDPQNIQNEEESSVFRKSVLLSFLLGIFFVSIMFNAPLPSKKEIEEEIKQQVVKIIKKQKQRTVEMTFVTSSRKKTAKKPTKMTKKAIKRMGALAVLGSLSQSKQKGGLDLGAVKKSAGPGLGGTQGSGGVQTSLYAKGIVSAPLGVGGNLKGAGGYGTKGKGGGKAGYGKLSLVGSAGTSVIPVGTEIISGGGLSNDDIWAVIFRNQGQIRFCYEQGLQSDPKLKGVVRTQFTIDSNGRVSKVNIVGTTVNSKIVEDCIALRIKSWKFPLPKVGRSISIKVPFNLTKQGRG